MNQLQKFQQKYGLEPDGVIGKITIGKMKQVWQLSHCEVSHFLGQITHETGHFKYEVENLNYSAEALLKVFRKYFPTWDAAKEVARNPEAIANIVYGGRMGNEEPGDGWKFRGRGAIQLTGRNNYQLFSVSVDDPCIMDNPDLVIEKYYFESALFYFTSNNLWKLCSEVDNKTITAVTKRVNGGKNGLEDRMRMTYKYNLMIS